jgi:seryl-tRNA synthetase
MRLSHSLGPEQDRLMGLAGLDWYENGQSALSGDLLALYRKLDALFVRWTAERCVVEHHFPTFIPVRELQRIHYLQAFPHQATFAVTLQSEDENLAAFSDRNVVPGEGAVELTHTKPVTDILTPAACYHFYIHYQGWRLHEPLLLTTCSTCYRHERRYRPLQRQWSFNMRELVCLGSESEVKAFLVRQQAQVTAFVAALGVEARWQVATDPFFRPERQPKYLAQKVFPVKQELVLEDGLAIASVNRHHDHFGRAFDIQRADRAASSGCVAFGLERWLYALVRRYGADGLHEARAALEASESAC